MADVVLAECAGRAWLVRGEQHIDDLLNNSMPPDVSIEVIACETKLAIDALWRQWNGDEDTTQMWLIHPGILARVQRQGRPLVIETNEFAVRFTAWSAAMDEAGDRAVQDAATAARTLEDGHVVVISYLARDAPALAVGMADLRCGMVEAKLSALGVTRMDRKTRVAETDAQELLVELIVLT